MRNPVFGPLYEGRLFFSAVYIHPGCFKRPLLRHKSSVPSWKLTTVTHKIQLARQTPTSHHTPLQKSFAFAPRSTLLRVISFFYSLPARRFLTFLTFLNKKNRARTVMYRYTKRCVQYSRPLLRYKSSVPCWKLTTGTYKIQLARQTPTSHHTPLQKSFAFAPRSPLLQYE